MVNNTKKSTEKIKKMIPGVMVLIILILLFLNVGIGSCMTGGDCETIVFDKWSMLTADKVIIRVGEESHTVTDQEFIQQITKETLVATAADICIASQNDERWIEVYKGEKLVRKMHWRDAHHNVRVYNADGSHWIFPGSTDYGVIYLSEDMLKQLGEITGEEFEYVKNY